MDSDDPNIYLEYSENAQGNSLPFLVELFTLAR